MAPRSPSPVRLRVVLSSGHAGQGYPLPIAGSLPNPLDRGCRSPRHPQLIRFAPLEKGSPLLGRKCLGCDERFRRGQEGVLLPIGPGGDLGARASAARGEAYSGRVVPLHLACVTGEEDK